VVETPDPIGTRLELLERTEEEEMLMFQPPDPELG
jgi:hypothetical protein